MSVKSYPLSVILHLISFITYGYSLCWLFVHELTPRDKGTIGGRLKFLTYWDLWIQFITFTIALICDFISNPNNTRNKTKQPVIVGLRNTIFNSLALPIGVFVSISFWSLYAIDRELIFPVGIEKWYPIWLNHTTHTIILPIVLIENYLVDHNRRNQKNGLTLLLAVIVTYGAWVLYLGIVTNHWVYPVLEVIGWPQRVAFIVGNLIIMNVFYLLGGLLYDMGWKSNSKASKAKESRKRQ